MIQLRTTDVRGYAALQGTSALFRGDLVTFLKLYQCYFYKQYGTTKRNKLLYRDGNIVYDTQNRYGHKVLFRVQSPQIECNRYIIFNEYYDISIIEG